ncbi:DUF3990 domain-containing protein [Succinimonas sp.]|uniref:DUF3990 domain-containing protein n=1 Tax=Succinimonas sp. TaxID=1936151 RepID=UPI00386F49BB
MQNVIFEIRKQLKVSQDGLAKLLDVSSATVKRWENGHSAPNKAAELRLYEVCREYKSCQNKSVDLEERIRKKIRDAVSEAGIPEGRIILYHGSKSGITGPIAPVSRERCDFGRGFYLGTDPLQPLTLISDFEESRFYVIGLDLADLRVLRLSPDIEWAMLVAFWRGKLDGIRDSALYDRYRDMTQGWDVITGSIVSDVMFHVIDDFFLGRITDKALVMSLAALPPGEQYVAVTEKACSHAAIAAEIPLSHLERAFLRDFGAEKRRQGVNLVNGISRDYRREGLFFDEILKSAAEEKESGRPKGLAAGKAERTGDNHGLHSA